jgi:predicted nuclease with TOPRIM domain
MYWYSYHHRHHMSVNTTEIDTVTEVETSPQHEVVVEVKRERKIPPMPSTWAQVVKQKRKHVEQVEQEQVAQEPTVALAVFNAMQEHAEELEGQLASKVAEIDDLVDEQNELKSQINALQRALEETEAKLVVEVPVEEAAVEVVATVAEVVEAITEATEVVVPMPTDTTEAVPAEATTKGWFGWW